MSELNIFPGPNAGFILELYERYLQNPEAVDKDTRTFFAAMPQLQPFASNGHSNGTKSNGSTVNTPPPTIVETLPSSTSPQLLNTALAAARLARLIRQRGHLGADIDPLHLSTIQDVGLENADHGLTPEILNGLPSQVVGGPIARETDTALQAIDKLRQVYWGSVGYEFEHIQDADERHWLRDQAENGTFFKDIDAAKKRDLLYRLIEVDAFEQFIHQNFQNQKRFSIEGTDALVPILDEIIHCAAIAGTHEVVLGMAHRGRLNVLTHVLGKPYANVFQEFRKSLSGGSVSVSGGSSGGWLGDVKYHLGYHRMFRETGVDEMPLTLVPNPSHLEFVNAVTEGHARAAQEIVDQPGAPMQNTRDALPVLIHGDSAFPGQGIVAETLNMSGLTGYQTGGTIHIISNNQIGFTTVPADARSTLYASDLAKGFEIPIVHVNADDPIAYIACARMAYAYREKFNKDFLIDLLGYRRYGHNEGDEPRTTQPVMYEIIDKHPRAYERWATVLEQAQVVSADDVQKMVSGVRSRLQKGFESEPEPDTHAGVDAHSREPKAAVGDTGVAEDILIELNQALLERPAGFTANARAERTFYAPRRERLLQQGGIQWAHAETLALASILADGTPIRMSGQDTERGTFDQRRLVLYDINSGQRYVPLQHLQQACASFAVYNSPLSENAVLGFEYGYSIHAPKVLVVWEAQFGDFSNGAQVIIDQFIASGNAKWRQTPSLVLLLPHGYEGQGPEHSSARIERFLQLAASDNLRVVNCTTAAQYFHLLRRQAALLQIDPRPLIVFTPKSLLRDVNAASSLNELSHGRFLPVIDDARARERAGQITRLILCSGKVYMNLAYDSAAKTDLRAAFAQSDNIAAVRVEELYPFPEHDLKEVIASYPNLREIVWLQEEPRNMGPWNYMAPRLTELIEQMKWQSALLYIGRGEAASPAEGSMPRHEAEQARIIAEALCPV